MRANRDAPLREQGGGSQPPARTTISARESAGAIIDRHMARQHIQSANRQPVAPPSSLAPAPAPSTARATSTTAAVWHPLPHPALALLPAGSKAQAASERALAAVEQQRELMRELKRRAEHAQPLPASKPRRDEPTVGASSGKFVPWREYSQRTTGIDPGPGIGQQVLLLGPPVEPPPGWAPRVHGLASEQRELQRRGLEATRIVPAVSLESWVKIFDEPCAELRRWPAARLRGEQLDAICRIAGHSRLAALRCELHKLNAYCVRAYGMAELAIMRERLSATKLRSYLRSRDDAALTRKRAAEARAASGQPPEETAEDGGGAASAALSLMGTATRGLCVDWAVESGQLDEFRGRPATREGGGAVDPEATLVLHFELGADDPTLVPFVRDCFALAALEAHTCVRAALGKRSRRPRADLHGMAVGSAGMDLKKGQWRSAGRPLIMSVHGYSGSDGWYVRSCSVLDKDDFNTRRKSLLRAHDGADGDPRTASAWLDREPSDHEWNRTLAHLCAMSVSAVQPNGSRAAVQPHLVFPDGPSEARMPTKHSLKKIKISAYVALGLHPHYAVEAGAHAGSAIERMSVAGMSQQIGNLQPKGLVTALRYARASAGSSVAEVDHLVFRAVRQWVAETGLAALPRTGSWAALTAWANRRVFEREMRPITIAVSVTRPPEPPLPESTEELAGAEPEPEIEIEVECDMES